MGVPEHVFLCLDSLALNDTILLVNFTRAVIAASVAIALLMKDVYTCMPQVRWHASGTWWLHQA